MTRAGIGLVLCLALNPWACRNPKATGSEPAPGTVTPGADHAKSAPTRPVTSHAAPYQSAPATPSRAPLSAEQPVSALPVPGFGDAVISLPLGATGPRPVVVALHGNYDRPEWQCAVWREITRGHAWVLCPRGVRRSDAPRGADRWTFAGLPRFEKELFAGLAALDVAHGPYVDREHPVFAGFSLGAILGVHLLKKPDSPFERAVLIEGGYRGWGVAGARSFAARGGKKLLLGCGQSACLQAGREAKRLFDQGPVALQVVSGGNVGHTYDGEVARAVAERWAWLVQDDARFSVTGSASGP